MYRYPSLEPVMDWLPADTPVQPVINKISGNPESGLLLEWQDSVPTSSSYYVIYRFSDDEPVNLEDATRIIGIVPRNIYPGQSWTDYGAAKRTTYKYVITALSRLHHESQGSGAARIRTRGSKRDITNLAF